MSKRQREMDMELKVCNVTKMYGANRALDRFTYTFTPGVYGLLGPNGAGKSTLMNIITTNLPQTEGVVTYNGKDISVLGKEYRAILGFMPQQQGIYPGYTLESFLWYMASLKGLNKQAAKAEIERLLPLVNLEDNRRKRLGSFSGGMKQRALIAQALLGNPEVIILDEPTAGLDPKERIRIRNLIAEIALDKIVIIATHVVSDIEFIAKEVLFLKKGSLIRSGAPLAVCEEIKDKVYELAIGREDIGMITERFHVRSLREHAGGVVARVLSDAVPEEYAYVACEPEIEDVYLYHFD